MNFAVINEHDKGDVMHFEISSGTFTMLFAKRSSKTGLFRHLSNHVLRVCNFENTKAIKLIFFLQNVQNFSKTSKKQQKIPKKFFVSEIIPSELVSLNILY